MIRIRDGAHGELFALRSESADVRETVAKIIADVKERGDAALLEYTRRFDGASLTALEVTQEERERALTAVPTDFLRVLRRAAENIQAFHSLQRREGFEMRLENGVVQGQRVIPLEKVGVYIPGGTACYPSSVLMNCIPAKLAGVGELILVTPPRATGASPIFCGRGIGGADRHYRGRGAQAIAALAYGDESIPSWIRCGPGNAYVARGQRRCSGRCPSTWSPRPVRF